jgi:hypothetical protein
MSQTPPAEPVFAPPKKSNTTLIIVLVVAALGGCLCLIPILAAILFPVFSQAKRAAQATACLSNVKQSANALIMYSVDFDDRLPRADRWMDSIESYAQSDSVFRCPVASLDSPGAFGIGFNAEASKWKLADLPEPQGKVLIFDARDTSRNSNSSPIEPASPGRHSKGGAKANNYGYADGQARRVADDENR